MLFTQKCFRLILSVNLLLIAFHSHAIESTQDNDRTFDSWVERLKNQAFSKGISEGTIDNAFFSVQHLSISASGTDVPAIDAIVPRSYISPHRVALNKQLLNHFKDVLFEIKHLFNVDQEVIIAIWSLDIQLSKNTQYYPAINVLANLSYQQPSNKSVIDDFQCGK